MPRNTKKRAAAAIAEEKIKQAIEDIIRDGEGLNEEHANKEDQPSAFDFPVDEDPATKRTKSTLTLGGVSATIATNNNKAKGSHQKRARKESKADDLQRAGNVPFLQSEESAVGGGYGRFPSRSSIPSTAIRQHQEHQKRKAAREVHSNGPMFLSRRTSYKIAKDASPIYSPIAAIRISFTPESYAMPSPPPLMSSAAQASIIHGRRRASYF